MSNLDSFALDGKRNLLDETHFSIASWAMTLGVPYQDVGSFRGLFAPPYGSSDFLCEVRFFGEKAPTAEYTWLPFEVIRRGSLEGLEIESKLVLPPEGRGGLLAMTLRNTTSKALAVPLQFTLRGGFGYEAFWEFSFPLCADPTEAFATSNQLIRRNPAGASVLATDLAGMSWLGYADHWEGSLELAPGECVTRHLAFAIGPELEAVSLCEALIAEPAQAIIKAEADWERIAEELFTRLPRLEASDERLVNWYNRSLVHLLLNQWHISELILNPYYSTGGLNGGCFCCYLWDFGEAWELLPLFDPAASRAHIKRFLVSDMTSHFAFTPVTGEAFGPWYPVNQEKLVHLIYYYVMLTGDTTFLHELVDRRSIIEHAIFHATYGDDLTQPARLIDYGIGNNHLELRKSYRYDNVLPDLNGRRCTTYQLAAKLCRLGGRDSRLLQERATELATLVKAQLWDPEIRWFHNLDPAGGKHTRYTVQLFKLIGGGALDAEEEAGLISHLNEEEFLSDWGLHSLSKQDEAFDQLDIDNGGGGCYTAFPPQIIEKLYKAHHPEVAEELLKRLLWWGERTPYWGDSFVANNLDYRRDTPLQNTIGGVAAAQAVVFGLFGVAVQSDWSIRIAPQPPAFSPELKLTGLKLLGHCIDIFVNGSDFTVIAEGQRTESVIGRPVIIAPLETPIVD